MLQTLGSECAQFVDLECWWCLWPKASFWDNFRQIIAGSKAVVVRTALPPVLDVKKLPVRPNRPDLRPSLSKTTLPFMWVRPDLRCMWPKLPDRRPSWSEQWRMKPRPTSNSPCHVTKNPYPTASVITSFKICINSDPPYESIAKMSQNHPKRLFSSSVFCLQRLPLK